MAAPEGGEFIEKREPARIADRKSIAVATTALALVATVVPYQPGWDRILYSSLVLSFVVVNQVHWEKRHELRVALGFVGALLLVAVIGRIQVSLDATSERADDKPRNPTTTTSSTTTLPGDSDVGVQGRTLTREQFNQLESCRAAMEVVAVAVRDSPMQGVVLTSDNDTDQVRQLEECQLRLAAIDDLLPRPR